MYLYKDNKNKDQKRFFSSIKITRIRERTTTVEDVQRQHQLVVQEKKLQIAIERTEKAREIKKKKKERKATRQIVREQLTQEKAERQTVRET